MIKKTTPVSIRMSFGVNLRVAGELKDSLESKETVRKNIYIPCFSNYSP